MNWRQHEALESWPALDILALRRDGLLEPGRAAVASWSLGRTVRSVAAVRCVTEHLLMVRFHAGEEERDQPVRVTWTPCRFGGRRPWFVCPGCDRRTVKLYERRVFACRRCLKLAHRSRQSSKWCRSTDQSLALRRRLGCDKGFLLVPAHSIPRPPRMHWKTYYRLIRRLELLDARALADSMAFLGL